MMLPLEIEYLLAILMDSRGLTREEALEELRWRPM